VFGLANGVGAKINLSRIVDSDFERLKSKEVDLILSAAYPFKIPSWHGYVSRAVNIHPSLLPNGRGPWPLPWTILSGEPLAGVTVHEIAPKFDAGDILLQSSIGVSERENLSTLSFKLQVLAETMCATLTQNLDALWSNKFPQVGGNYRGMPDKSDRTIKFEMTPKEIDLIYRAFYGFEPFIYMDNIRYFVRGLDTWTEEHNLEPGTCVRQNPRQATYAVQGGFMTLSGTVRADEQKTQ
jgi:methionyl-tRNA formyltransferase